MASHKQVDIFTPSGAAVQAEPYGGIVARNSIPLITPHTVPLANFRSAEFARTYMAAETSAKTMIGG